MAETLDSFRTGEEISEDDAMTAKAELAAVRDECYDHELTLRTAESSAAGIRTEFSS